MVFPKEVWFGFIPLVFCYTGSQPGFTTLYEDLMEINSPRLHEREKREVPTNTNDYEFQAVLGLSELEVLEVFLKNLSFPILINSTSQISSLDTTTVCSPNVTGYQCVCEENFAWSHNSCIAYGVCDVRLGDTCGCINDLPADGQFCQPNSSQIDATKCDLTPTPPTVTSSPPINYSAPDNKVTNPTLAKELQATENKETVITEIIQNKTLKSSTPGTPVMNATTSERDTTVGAVSRLLIVPSTTLNITTLGPSQNTNVSLISEKDPHTTMTNETTAKETVETTSTAVILEMSQSTEEKHEYSIRTTKATGLEDQGAATILGITLNTSISNAITPDQSQITTMTNAVTAEIAVETTSSASRPATRGNRETDAYSTGRTLNTELIAANTRGTDLNTIVTNETTAREAVETTSSAVISEISLSTEEKHEYSVRTTKTTGLEDATSPGLALNTTVTKVTTLGLADKGAATILGITLNTSVSSAITPDQSQITTMTNETIAKEAVQAPSKAVILEMSLSTIRPENQNTTMANASSPEITLDTIVTNVTTTQIVVEITSNATKPKTTGHLTGTHETAPITLNTMVLNVVIAEQNKNTTMSNATSPDMILDTTNVTATQMAVETTSSASRPATLGNTETDAYSTGRTLNMGLIDVNTQGTDLNTKVTNVTTAKEAVETTSRALISEISLSTEEKHKYSVRTTKTTGLKDTTSPRLALNTTVTNVTTGGLGDQGAPTILGKPLNTSVSNAITPDQSQITTMRNATSPEIILHMTNVNTTQIAVETTSSASRPATLGNTETDAYSTERTLNTELIDANTRGTDLNTIVTNVTTAKITVEPTVVHEVAPETVVHATIQGITLNTTMSNATSPEIILDTTNVTATKTQEFNETFTINMDFNNSYNDPSSKVYKDVYGAAKSSCQKFQKHVKSRV
ncbi:mucin-2-like isoform X1 [Gambusia affinis]|uniref:mucin-2-like isoform X1 n=1 Tax=Gambusia affinis TaxID=33528 RepID=UPI001CDBD8E2|nr:mucin-2-like isoform X1 [Gambusia affinis]XP_043962758.1 mucin-2-like isoform X1 [Gambusia affinis]